MVGRKPINHANNCYFCAIDLTGINRKNRRSLEYPDLESARRPVLHCDEIPVPVCGDLPAISEEDSSTAEENEDVVFEADTPRLLFQETLNNLVCDLSLSKLSAELLASRLKENKFLSDSARIAFLPQQA